MNPCPPVARNPEPERRAWTSSKPVWSILLETIWVLCLLGLPTPPVVSAQEAVLLNAAQASQDPEVSAPVPGPEALMGWVSPLFEPGWRGFYSAWTTHSPWCEVQGEAQCEVLDVQHYPRAQVSQLQCPWWPETAVLTADGFWFLDWRPVDEEDLDAALAETPPLLSRPLAVQTDVTERSGDDFSARQVWQEDDLRWCVSQTDGSSTDPTGERKSLVAWCFLEGAGITSHQRCEGQRPCTRFALETRATSPQLVPPDLKTITSEPPEETILVPLREKTLVRAVLLAEAFIDSHPPLLLETFQLTRLQSYDAEGPESCGGRMCWTLTFQTLGVQQPPSATGPPPTPRVLHIDVDLRTDECRILDPSEVEADPLTFALNAPDRAFEPPLETVPLPDWYAALFESGRVTWYLARIEVTSDADVDGAMASWAETQTCTRAEWIRCDVVSVEALPELVMSDTECDAFGHHQYWAAETLGGTYVASEGALWLGRELWNAAEQGDVGGMLSFMTPRTPLMLADPHTMSLEEAGEEWSHRARLWQPSPEVWCSYHEHLGADGVVAERCFGHGLGIFSAESAFSGGLDEEATYVLVSDRHAGLFFILSVLDSRLAERGGDVPTGLAHPQVVSMAQSPTGGWQLTLRRRPEGSSPAESPYDDLTLDLDLPVPDP